MLDDQYMTAKEAAAYLHTTENNLRSMRSTGNGPPFHRLDGWHTLYRQDELDAYQATSRPSRRKARMERARAEKERVAPGSTPVRP